MRRREFLAVAAAAPTLAAKPSFGRDRLSAISDEMGRTPEEALAFAQKFALKFLEIRNVPGAKTHYYQLTEPELKTAAKQFSDAGIRISYFNTPYLKILLPGTKPANQKMLNDLAQLQARSDAAYARRTEDLKMGIRAAHLLSVDKLRVFTGWRVEKPESVFAQAADILGEMAELCAREKVQLLVENEAACNVATCTELAGLMKLLPQKSVGINWDPLNGFDRGEEPYPMGYSLLPKKRIGNVQVKGRSLLDPEKKLDWAAIKQALQNDGYPGKIGLETHYFDGTMFEKSHLCMQELVRLMEPS